MVEQNDRILPPEGDPIGGTYVEEMIHCPYCGDLMVRQFPNDQCSECGAYLDEAPAPVALRDAVNEITHIVLVQNKHIAKLEDQVAKQKKRGSSVRMVIAVIGFSIAACAFIAQWWLLSRGGIIT